MSVSSDINALSAQGWHGSGIFPTGTAERAPCDPPPRTPPSALTPFGPSEAARRRPGGGSSGRCLPTPLPKALCPPGERAGLRSLPRGPVRRAGRRPDSAEGQAAHQGHQGEGAQAEGRSRPSPGAPCSVGHAWTAEGRAGGWAAVASRPWASPGGATSPAAGDTPALPRARRFSRRFQPPRLMSASGAPPAVAPQRSVLCRWRGRPPSGVRLCPVLRLSVM